MRDEPVLRATSESGATCDDPSEDMIYMLLEELGDGGFLIIERTADPGGQTYAQAARNDDGTFVVEHREGSAEQHYGTTAPDVRAAHKLLTGWAFHIAGWRDGASWAPVR